MRTSSSFIRMIINVLLIALISGCRTASEAIDGISDLAEVTNTQPSNPSETPEPSATPKPPLLATLEARTPDFIITFDDSGCSVQGPESVEKGEYLFVVHNRTDFPLVLWVAPYQNDGSYEGHSIWFEENCGGQGSHCENEEGNTITYPLIGWINSIMQAQEDNTTYYKVYDLKTPREHIIQVSKDGWWEWLCTSLQVTE